MWIFPGWFHPSWWNVSDAECTAEEMGSALEHSFAVIANDEVKGNQSRIIVSNKVNVMFNDPLVSY